MIRVSNFYVPSRLFVFAGMDGLFLTTAFFFSFRGLPAHKALIASCEATVIFIACFYLCDLYDLDATRKSRDVLLRSLRAVGIGSFLLTPAWAALFWFHPSVRFLEVNLILFMALLCSYRAVWEWLHDRAFPGEKILLVGSDPSIHVLADALRQRLSLPLKLSAIVPERRLENDEERSFALCEDITKIPEVMGTFRAQRVAISTKIESSSDLAKELLALRRQGIRIEDATSLYQALTGRVPVSLLDIRRLIFGKGMAVSRVSSGVRRFFDCGFAISALLCFAPLLALITILIKLDSRGPVLYRQERVGLNGEKFKVYKFRSMCRDAEKQSGPVWAASDDARVTHVGRVLRKLRLDELPQFINVLRGDMLLIGPRPERPHFVDMLRKEIPFYDLRHSVRPGITGWAQVSAGYGSTIEESQEKLEYDLFYILNRSVALDALIFLKTTKIMICGKGAR